MQTVTDGYVTLDEAAKFLNLHPQTVREKARKGLIPAYTFGKRYCFILEELRACVKPITAKKDGNSINDI